MNTFGWFHCAKTLWSMQACLSKQLICVQLLKSSFFCPQESNCKQRSVNKQHPQVHPRLHVIPHPAIGVGRTVPNRNFIRGPISSKTKYWDARWSRLVEKDKKLVSLNPSESAKYKTKLKSIAMSTSPPEVRRTKEMRHRQATMCHWHATVLPLLRCQPFQAENFGKNSFELKYTWNTCVSKGFAWNHGRKSSSCDVANIKRHKNTGWKGIVPWRWLLCSWKWDADEYWWQASL